MEHKIIYNFKAKISLYTTADGGRKKPVYNFYKPSFSFSTQQHFSGEISELDKEELKPGDTATALIKLLPSRHILHNLKSGDAFTILEGNKIIGTGVIQKIQLEKVA